MVHSLGPSHGSELAPPWTIRWFLYPETFALEKYILFGLPAKYILRSRPAFWTETIRKQPATNGRTHVSYRWASREPSRGRGIMVLFDYHRSSYQLHVNINPAIVTFTQHLLLKDVFYYFIFHAPSACWVVLHDLEFILCLAAPGDSRPTSDHHNITSHDVVLGGRNEVRPRSELGVGTNT